MQPKLPNLCVQLALTMVGRHEQPLGSNSGPEIQEFFAADNYKPNKADNGYAWCASFVCRIVQLAMAKAAVPFTFQRPVTASAFGLAEWSRDQDASTSTKDFPKEVKAGDIVIFTWSHCGIAITDSNARGEFEFDHAGSWALRYGQDGRGWTSWRKHYRTPSTKHQFYAVRSTTDDPAAVNKLPTR